MPRGLVKLNDGERDWYIDWSTNVDAPVTYGMSREELTEYIREEYGAEGLRELPRRLARLDAKGTSFLDDTSADDTIACNRAGPGEMEITKAEIIARYCKRKR